MPQVATMIREDRLTAIVAALIAERVTSSSAMTGTGRSSAVGIVADARLIMAELDRK